MRKKLNVKKLLKANPSVNRDEVVEALKMLKTLKQSGVVISSGYNLAIPFSKRVVQADDSRELGRPIRRK
jgi:hypothetical protein